MSEDIGPFIAESKEQHGRVLRAFKMRTQGLLE